MQTILSLDLDLNPLSLLLGLPESNVTSLANRRLVDVMTFSAWKILFCSGPLIKPSR